MRNLKVSILFPSISANGSFLRLWDLRGAKFRKKQMMNSNKSWAPIIKIMSISGSITNKTKSFLIARLKSTKISIKCNQCNAFSPSARPPLPNHTGQATAKETTKMTLVSIITCPPPTAQSLSRGRPLRTLGKISAVISFHTVKVCQSSSPPTTKAICHRRATKCQQPFR